MASSQMCGPCARMSKSAAAVKVCTDCEDPLCTVCVNNHKAIKTTALHHLIDEKVQVNKAFSIKRTCSDHPDMSLEFYCSNHESLCCRTCSVNTHRTCGKILPIEVAARGIKSSVMLNDVTTDLKGLLKIAEQLIEVRVKTIEGLGNSKATILRQIAQIKRELDFNESTLVTKVDVSVKDLIRNVKSDISNIEILRKAIVDMSEQLELLTKHGSECQILMLLNYIRVDISKQKDYCHKYITIRLT